MTEVWGRNNRSIGIGIMFAFYPLGYLFSILVFRLVTPIWGWRAVYLFSLVPALIILALRFRLEESPRFSAVLSTDQLSGPIRIAEVSGAMARIGLAALLTLAAALSISVGMLNLLPVPLLDGGHLVYYAVEAMRGKAMNERAQQFGFDVGVVLLTSLMFFATYNDILRLARHWMHGE